MEVETGDATTTFLLYENIENMKQLKDLLMKGQLQVAVVNPELVFHIDQLILASYNCLYSMKHNQLKTKSVFTELLYNLFPTRSIRDSLKMFGAQDDGTAAIFVVFNKENEEPLISFKNFVNGCPAAIDKILRHRNLTSIKKLYKIGEDISDEEVILNCILSKMSSKHVL